MSEQQLASELLSLVGLSAIALEKTMAALSHRDMDDADVFLQSISLERWSLEDGRVSDAQYSQDQGVGLRAVQGEQSGFAFTQRLGLAHLLEAAKVAGQIVQFGTGALALYQNDKVPSPIVPQYAAESPLSSLSDVDKVALLKQLESEIQAKAPEAESIQLSLMGRYEWVVIYRQDGQMIVDRRPLIRLDAQVVLAKGDRREVGYSGVGGRHLYTDLAPSKLEKLVNESIHTARVKLEAKPSPAGVFPVILGSGWPGVLLHEAVGHGLEGDFNRKGTSAYSGRVGEKVASSLCTVVDDGTIAKARGSLNVDDEGTPTQCTTLIENGILKGYMHDRQSARLMKTAPTGNGRRESYAYLPMPRMTNTYMLAGSHTLEEMIASVDKGVYAVNFAGGQVDITSGQFVFSASEAYWIEKGQITHPIKGVTLMGNGPDALERISMVGNDLALDDGIGTCGKQGQSVPVGVGQPSLKVDQLTIGGTEV